MLLIPSLLGGTLIGVYLKKMLPDVILLAVLCGLLGYAIRSISQKAIDLKS